MISDMLYDERLGKQVVTIFVNIFAPSKNVYEKVKPQTTM